MKKVRFTEEQMVASLREADRNPIADVARMHKVGERTIYVWRRRFGTTTNHKKFPFIRLEFRSFTADASPMTRGTKAPLCVLR